MVLTIGHRLHQLVQLCLAIMVRITYIYTQETSRMEDQIQSLSPLGDRVLLGLYSGSGLQRTQRGYKSHPRDLPLAGPEYRVHSQVNNV